jgi:hypothetical protein
MAQYIYILIAMVMLMNLVVSTTRVDIGSTSDMATNQIRNDAVSLAQSTLEEIWTKSFDEKLSAGATQSTWTAFDRLGKESGETYSTFDDIDDYNSYSKDILWGASNLNVSVSIRYCNPMNANFAAAGITYNKLITVTVTSKMNTKVRNRTDKVRVQVYQIYSRLTDE